MEEKNNQHNSPTLFFTFEELRFIVRNIGRGHNKREVVDMYEMRETCDEMKKLIRNGSNRVERRIHKSKSRIGQSQTGSQGG